VPRCHAGVGRTPSDRFWPNPAVHWRSINERAVGFYPSPRSTEALPEPVQSTRMANGWHLLGRRQLSAATRELSRLRTLSRPGGKLKRMMGIDPMSLCRTAAELRAMCLRVIACGIRAECHDASGPCRLQVRGACTDCPRASVVMGVLRSTDRGLPAPDAP
jgi:hypothetical protein